MAGHALFKAPHSCGSSDGLQVFEKEDGTVDGYCFSCKTYVPNPLGEHTLESFPIKKRIKKTKEEIAAEIAEISTYPVDDLPDRRLRKDVLDRFGIKLGYDEETASKVKFHYYPYTKDGELKSYKTRLVEDKRMWSVGDQADVDLFGWEQALATGARRLIITEGECFLPDTEVFTRQGWVPLEEWNGQEVMQVFSDQRGQFVQPLGLVDKHYSGNLIEYKSGSYYSLTTPDHNLVRVAKNGGLFKTPAKNPKQKHRNVPRVLRPNSPFSDDNLELRIKVMVSADFTIRENGDLYAGFKKTRKVERAKRLLDAKGVRYSCILQHNGYHSFFIHRGHGLEVSKLFQWEDILEESDTEVFLDEVLYWDGNSVVNRNQIEYSSKFLHNAEVVQAAAHLRGYTSTIMRRENTYGSWYKVSIFFGKQTSSTQNGYREVPYSGRVMCLTVPSGMLLVRQKGSVSISGNCDAVALVRILEMHTQDKWKDYMPAVCSLPHGSSSAGRDLARLASKIRRHFKEVSFCFDNDKAGELAVEAACKVFPEATVVTLPSKDANQCILDGKTKAAHKAAIFNKDKPKNTRLVWGREVHEAAKKPAEWGVPWPWEKLTEMTRGIRKGETYYLGAAQKMG